MSSEAYTSYHGIAARLDRIPITGMHRKVLWLLAGITFCDSVDMGVGGPIGAVLQSTYDAAGNQWMTLEQFALFNSITMIGYLVGGLMAGALSDGIGRKKAVLICGSIFTAFCFVAAGSPDATFLTGSASSWVWALALRSPQATPPSPSSLLPRSAVSTSPTLA